jgi:hypothetical protein
MCYGMEKMSASEDLRVMLSLVFLYQIHKKPYIGHSHNSLLNLLTLKGPNLNITFSSHTTKKWLILQQKDMNFQYGSLLILVIWPPKVENSKFLTKREDKKLDTTCY